MVWQNYCCDFYCDVRRTIDVVFVPVQRNYMMRLLLSGNEILLISNSIYLYLIFFALAILFTVSLLFLVTSACVI